MNNAESAPCPGAFFPHATRFTIRGGEFTSNNITNHFHNPPEEEFSEFEPIRLGNIKLRKEFKEMRIDDQSGIVDRQSRGTSVRRMYTAELCRDPGRVTVAMYEGGGAEEEWRKHVARYESIRHPNIMQIYGLVRTRGLYAMVFHDEMIPFNEFFTRFQHSPVLTTYIRGYCSTEYRDALDYLHEIQDCIDLPSVWIRPATGNLCVDLVPALQLNEELFWWDKRNGRRFEDVSLDNPEAEAVVIANLNEDEYYELCFTPPMVQFRALTTSISTQLPLGLESIIRMNPQDGSGARVTEPLALDRQNPEWQYVRDEAEVLANSWIRYDSYRACNLELSMRLWHDATVRKFWLAQANHIFTRLEATSHLENYGASLSSPVPQP